MVIPGGFNFLMSEVPLCSLICAMYVQAGDGMCGDLECKLAWREAGPPHHHDDKVDPDQ